jgi:hypothetical protein
VHVERHGNVCGSQQVNVFEIYGEKTEYGAGGQPFRVLHKAVLRAVKSTVYDTVSVNYEERLHGRLTSDPFLGQFYHMPCPGATGTEEMMRGEMMALRHH